jgi:hypothetical protein
MLSEKVIDIGFFIAIIVGLSNSLLQHLFLERIFFMP